MKNTISSIMPLKILLVLGSVLLSVAASILFGFVDESVLSYAGDEKLAARLVYTTGGFGLVVMLLAGLYYFQYRYRL